MYGLWERFLTFVSLWLNWNVLKGPDATDGIVSRELKVWMDGLRERWGVHGMSVAIVTSPDYQYGSGEWQQEVLSFGTADGRGRPINEESIWSLPSTSKFITTLGLARLIESNITLENGELLDWNTRLETIFPGWTDPPPWDMGNKFDPCDITISSLGEMGFNAHSPDSQFRFVWRIVRDLSGATYSEALENTILSDLGLKFMLSTSLTAEQRKHRVDGFIREGVDLRQCAEDAEKDGSISHTSCLGNARNVGWWTEHFKDWSWIDDEWYAGAGGLVLPSKEVPKLLRALLDPKSDMARLTTVDPSYAIARDVASLGGFGSGFGVYYPWYEEEPMVDHIGSWGGQTSMMFWMPESGIGMSIAVNDQYYGDDIVQMLAWRLKDELLHSEWERDYEAGTVRSLHCRTDRHPTPPLNPSPPLYSIEDTFIHDTFGKFIVRENFDVSEVYEHRTEYEAIMQAISSQTTYPLNISSHFFITDSRDKIVGDRVLFTHWDADRWNWTLIKQYRANEGFHHSDEKGARIKDGKKLVVEILGTGAAEVKQSGIKFHNGWWSACGIQMIRHSDNTVEMPGSDSFALRLEDPQLQQFFEDRRGIHLVATLDNEA